FGVTACGSKTAQEAEKETLTVAMELAYPPFETKDEQGQPAGVSVDLIQAFGAYVGKEIKIENTAWDGLIPSLETGKADMVISSMTITEERQKAVDFSQPYANAMLAVLANKSSGIKSPEDLNQEGRSLAVKTGSTGATYGEKQLSKAKLINLADESACVTEVTQGKADGFIYDQLTIYRNHQKNPDTTEAIFIPNQQPEKWGIAVKKGNKKLKEQLDAFLQEYREKGGFEQLSEKHLKEEKKAFDELGFTWFFDLNQ
ncbi:MAG: transporter substrate-binding domain-containing protein, partial [Anaerovoracaceae bacterium]